jgi:L-lactate dehydrogenase (cytochrome)
MFKYIDGSSAAKPKMFQIHILKGCGLMLELEDQCKAAKYQALCLTVDMAMAGKRAQHLCTGMVMPPRFGLKSMWSFATHPY